MSGSLIIDARHRLRWHQRLISDASTTMMWGAWLQLWTPVLGALGSLTHTAARSPPTMMNLLASGSAANHLEYCVMALAGASGTLLMWKGLPASRMRTPAVQSLRDYARHFALPEAVILAGRRASVCVVHHDDGGRIVRLECRTVSCVEDDIAA
jgi:poly-beta-1,6-N-acetyl-D-glucosamine biosynthesis protein PgaD